MLVYVFNFYLFEFSAAILEKGLLLISSNTFVFRDHSVEPSKFLDSWSATTLLTPGRWHELSQIFLLLAHCQICNAMSL